MLGSIRLREPDEQDIGVQSFDRIVDGYVGGARNKFCRGRFLRGPLSKPAQDFVVVRRGIRKFRVNDDAVKVARIGVLNECVSARPPDHRNPSETVMAYQFANGGRKKQPAPG